VGLVVAVATGVMVVEVMVVRTVLGGLHLSKLGCCNGNVKRATAAVEKTARVAYRHHRQSRSRNGIDQQTVAETAEREEGWVAHQHRPSI